MQCPPGPALLLKSTVRGKKREHFLAGGGVDSNSGGSQRWERLTLGGICVATVCYVAINSAVSPQSVTTVSNALAEIGSPPLLGGCLTGFWALRSSMWWRAFHRSLQPTKLSIWPARFAQHGSCRNSSRWSDRV